MKVVRLHGKGELRLHEEPIPTPQAGEALVRVKTVGVCGSDVHWFTEAGIGTDHLSHPLVLGHEFAGVVENGEFTGQRIAVDPAIPCGTCEFCREGNPNFCESMRFAGHSIVDGALREYLNWPSRNLFPLPDELDEVEGAMLEPLGVAIHAVNLAHLQPGMSVGVFGCGPIGLLILQLARLNGTTQRIATEILPHRLAVARDNGATEVFPAEGGRENPRIWEATHRRGVEVAFEVAGENEAVETAVASARSGGKVILVGIPKVDSTTFTASTARRKGLTIKLVRRMKHTYPRAIKLVQSGLVDVRSLVTHRFKLENSAQAFATAERREGIKVVVEI